MNAAGVVDAVASAEMSSSEVAAPSSEITAEEKPLLATLDSDANAAITIDIVV